MGQVLHGGARTTEAVRRHLTVNRNAVDAEHRQMIAEGRRAVVMALIPRETSATRRRNCIKSESEPDICTPNST